jgi:hypothetical protein
VRCGQALFNDDGDVAVRAGAHEAWRALIGTCSMDRAFLCKERVLKLLLDPILLPYAHRHTRTLTHIHTRTQTHWHTQAPRQGHMH